MSDTNWRLWLYNKLVADPTVSSLVPVGSIYGAASLTGPPVEKPFIVISMGDEFGEFPGVSQQDVTLFFHDEPGSFLRIGDVMKAVRNALCGNGQKTGQAMVEGGIVCRWQSDSGDQADEGFHTIMRNSQFLLVGRDGNG